MIWSGDIGVSVGDTFRLTWVIELVSDTLLTLNFFFLECCLFGSTKSSLKELENLLKFFKISSSSNSLISRAVVTLPVATLLIIEPVPLGGNPKKRTLVVLPFSCDFMYPLLPKILNLERSRLKKWIISKGDASELERGMEFQIWLA